MKEMWYEDVAFFAVRVVKNEGGSKSGLVLCVKENGQLAVTQSQCRMKVRWLIFLPTIRKVVSSCYYCLLSLFCCLLFPDFGCFLVKEG